MPSKSNVGNSMDWDYIQSYFGGSNPIALNEYYRTNNVLTSIIPEINANASIPTFGQNSANNYYNKWGWQILSTNIVPGVVSYSQTINDPKFGSYTNYYYLNGYFEYNSTRYGTIGTNTYTTYAGTGTIHEIYEYRINYGLNGSWDKFITLTLDNTGILNTESIYNYISARATSTNLTNLFRSQGGTTTISSSRIRWSWFVAGGASAATSYWPLSGTVPFSIRYAG